MNKKVRSPSKKRVNRIQRLTCGGSHHSCGGYTTSPQWQRGSTRNFSEISVTLHKPGGVLHLDGLATVLLTSIPKQCRGANLHEPRRGGYKSTDRGTILGAIHQPLLSTWKVSKLFYSKFQDYPVEGHTTPGPG